MDHAIRQAPLSLAGHPLSPQQLLSAAIIAQALADAADTHVDAQCRMGAAAFLAGTGAMLRFWSQVAGLDPERVRQRAQQYLRRHARPPLKRLRRLRREVRLEQQRPVPPGPDVDEPAVIHGSA